MTLTKPVVVGLDGSKSATHARPAPHVEVKTELAAGNAAEQLIGRSTSASLLVRPRLAS